MTAERTGWPLQHRLDGEALALLGSSAWAALGGYLWTLLPGRLLAASEYANFLVLVSIIYFLVVALGPASQAVAYFVATRAAVGIPSGRSVRRIEGVVFITGCASCLVYGLGAPFLNSFAVPFSKLTMGVMLVSTTAVALTAVRRGYVQGLSRFRPYSGSVTLEALTRIVVMLILVRTAPRAYAAIGSFGIAALLAFLLLPRPSDSGSGELRPVLRYLGPTFVATIVYSAFTNTDILIVRWLASGQLAGFYGAASFLGRATGMLVTPFYVYSAPYLVSAADGRELRRRSVRLLASFLALEVAGVTSIALLRRKIVAIVFGQRYLPAAELLVPISIVFALAGLAFMVCQIPASRARFGFVPWYAVGIGVELVVVAMFHGSVMQIVAALAASQAVTVALVIPWAWKTLSSSRSSPETS